MVLGPGLQGSLPVAAAVPNSIGHRNVLYAASPFIFLVCFGIFSLVLNERSMYNLKLHNTANVSTSPAPQTVLKRSIEPTCMGKMELEQIHAAIVTAKNRIYSFWDVTHMPLFLTTMNIPQKSWDIQKLKFMQLLLESGSYRSGKGEDRNEYVVGFSGSSVTAGNDPDPLQCLHTLSTNMLSRGPIFFYLCISLHTHATNILFHAYFMAVCYCNQVTIVTSMKPILKYSMTQCHPCSEPCPG